MVSGRRLRGRAARSRRPARRVPSPCSPASTDGGDETHGRSPIDARGPTTAIDRTTRTRRSTRPRRRRTLGSHTSPVRAASPFVVRPIQGRPVAGRETRDDHLVGGARPAHEARRREGGVGLGDGHEPVERRRPGLDLPAPILGRVDGRALRRRRAAVPALQRDHLAGAATRLGRGGVAPRLAVPQPAARLEGVKGRPLGPGAGPQDGAQLPHHEDRQRGEDDDRGVERLVHGLRALPASDAGTRVAVARNGAHIDLTMWVRRPEYPRPAGG